MEHKRGRGLEAVWSPMEGCYSGRSLALVALEYRKEMVRLICVHLSTSTILRCSGTRQIKYPSVSFVS